VGRASTDDLREATIHDRTLFHELPRDDQERAAPSDERTEHPRREIMRLRERPSWYERVTENAGRHLGPFFERFSGAWFVVLLYALLIALFVIARRHI
jgi:hypothetical protein